MDPEAVFTILLFDSRKDVRVALATMFERHAWHVRTADDEDSALAQLPFCQAAICEVRTISEELRLFVSHALAVKDIPMMALSAHVMPEQIVQLKAMGFECVCAEPFSFEDLESTLIDLLLKPPTALGKRH